MQMSGTVYALAWAFTFIFTLCVYQAWTLGSLKRELPYLLVDHVVYLIMTAITCGAKLGTWQVWLSGF